MSPPFTGRPLLSSFHLTGLPYVAVLRILRFLDEVSLVRIRRTSRCMNRFVIHNRIRLVNEVDQVLIRPESFHSSEKIYCMDITKRSLKPTSRIDDCLQGYPSSSPLTSLLTSTFPRTNIKSLLLLRFDFNEEDLEGVEQAMKKSKMQIESICLSDIVIDSETSNTLRFLTKYHPREIEIHQSENLEHFRLLFTDSFFSLMSTLRSMKIDIGREIRENCIELPAHVNKIPLDFRTQKIFLMPMSTIVDRIQAWCDEEDDFGCWNIAIPMNDCPNLRHFSRAIGCVHDIVQYHDSAYAIDHSKIVVRNRGGKSVFLYETDPLGWPIMEGISGWTIQGGLYEEP